MKDMEKELIILREDYDKALEKRSKLDEALKAKEKELEELNGKLKTLTDDTVKPSWEEDEDLKVGRKKSLTHVKMRLNTPCVPLQDMPPADILEVVGSDLNPRERSLLNEMVVKQLQEELNMKNDELLSKMIESNRRQKELERLQMKIRCMEPASSSVEKTEESKKCVLRTSLLKSTFNEVPLPFAGWPLLNPRRSSLRPFPSR